MKWQKILKNSIQCK